MDWIPVTEKLPEKVSEDRSETVLTNNHFIAFYDFERKCWDDGDWHDDICGVTHWMPLPEPPK